MILAQVVGGYSLVHLAIAIVIVAAVIGLVFIAVRQFGIPIPDWVYQVCGIVFVAIVIIIAIKFVASL